MAIRGGRGEPAHRPAQKKCGTNWDVEPTDL